MDNKFQLWSPPLLDLSLDSFSNDLFQEFDKTRTSSGNHEINEVATISSEVQIKMNSPTINSQMEPTPEQLESLEIHQNSLLSSSPISSSVTLPPSERETSFHEEDSSSTANLFRKSSTFLKKKLSQNGSTRREENGSITTTNAEEISNIISRQYPPKPLHYSPVVETPSNSLQAMSINNNDTESIIDTSFANVSLPRNSREVITVPPPVKSNYSSKRMSDPMSSVTTSATATTATATVPAPPKRRSFFSLRFC
ncbi:hypothetical protein INT47_004984 [Mucor saturninus]|uniref:Uncharacterized protein n=1 Tax=Mucor saturninus TaxID=64648 RepID=A0A8H7QSM6_9FUNG|nr:hypothetical protein INT47_004984 [Mucor saturninus]